MDTLAQAYRWSYDEILKLTYPQVIMLNAAAEVNRKRLDARIKKRRADGESSLSEDMSDVPMINGRKLSDLTSEEYMNYLAGNGAKPRVIKTKKDNPPPA